MAKKCPKMCNLCGKYIERLFRLRLSLLLLCPSVRCGAVRCGAVRCGAVRCGAVRCGAVRCGAQMHEITDQETLARAPTRVVFWGKGKEVLLSILSQEYKWVPAYP